MTDKSLPKYTLGEEIMNAVTHIVGGVFGLIVLILVIIKGIQSNINSLGMFSLVMYGISIISLYSVSAIYHFLARNKAKRLFRILDHCTIYFLIIGTYLPICLISLQGSTAGLIILLLELFGFIIGITFNGINMHWKAVKVISMFLYVIMGWAAIFFMGPIIKVISLSGFLWILGGGLSYTVGILFYALGAKKKYIHSVWHIFVLMATVIQFIGIYLFVI